MSAALRVVAPGLMTTVQDLGRTGCRRLGVPAGGALDPISLRAANALIGNPPESGALEAAYVGPTLAVEAEDVRLAFVGATAAIDVLPDPGAARGERIAGMRSVRLRRGEAIRIGSLTNGAVLYVAVEGGFDIAPALGSVSTYVRGRLGGWRGRPLAAGDRLPLRRSRASAAADRRLNGVDLAPRRKIRAIAGPQADHFSAEEIAAFFAGAYTIRAGSDRMGMRLLGRPIAHARGPDIASDAVAPGSIQVPGDGQPIALLADGQTTGGYPKIATVISADLPALGRLPIGASISFEQVTLAAAQAARRALFAEIERINARIVAVGPSEDELASKLAAQNLISGFVDGRAS